LEFTVVSLVSDGRLPLSNEDIAKYLDETAELLEAQRANEFRVRAYRKAAATLRRTNQAAHEILAKEGLTGLMKLPGIGRSLARSIEDLAITGRFGLLERLRGDIQPENIFSTIAGIGPKMAERIHEELGIETLAELETTAYDGRLDRVRGMGSKRLRAVRESLAGRFRLRPRIAESQPLQRTDDEPSVAELLEIDRQYRERAAADRLIRIAPRRFNPTGEAWLPILHAHRNDRHYTALFSNTARAHELQMTKDWVVIYRDDHAGGGRWTVVTSRFGPLKGKRIVRGREKECEELYASSMCPSN
jgi:predicted flap endonuclease-1-like 5' DNA nuclease